jgi:drug/metabolite transporter (DMT)-like permease
MHGHSGPKIEASQLNKGLSAFVFTFSLVSLTLSNKVAFSSSCSSKIVLTITALQQLVVAVFVLLQTQVNGYMGVVDFSWNTFYRVLPVGILSAFDFGLTNVALKFLPVSIFQIVKCLTPAFVLVLGFIFGTSKPSWVLGLSIVLIVGGSCISVGSRASGVGSELPMDGLIILLLAIVAAALRTVVSQLVVKNTSDDQPPVSTAAATFHCAFQMFIVVLPTAIWAEYSDIVAFSSCGEVQSESFWIFVTMFLAYVVSVMGFWLTSVTSGLTTALCALLQRLITVLLAIYLLHETVKTSTWVGFSISLLGILVYNFESKIQGMMKASAAETDEELAHVAAAEEGSHQKSKSYGTQK